MANFDSEFFGLVFAGFQVTQKNSRPKFTSRSVGIPLQFHFLELKTYSRRFSAYGGDQHFWGFGVPGLCSRPGRGVCNPVLSNGFLQSEVLGEVSVLEGGSSGRSFLRSLPRSCPQSFRPCFAGTFRAKKTSAKTSAPNSHGPAQQNWRNFREKTS